MTRPFAVTNRWNEPEAFSGRYIAQRFQLNAYSLNPTVAYRLADRLAIGAGLDIRVSKMAMRHRYPGLLPVTNEVVDAASVRVDGRRDIAVRLRRRPARPPHREPLRRRAIPQRASPTTTRATPSSRCCPPAPPALDAAVADLIPAGTVPFQSSIRFPASINVGAAYVWGDWTFAGDVGFWQWSKFQQIAFDFEGREDLREVVVQDYADSAQIRVGAERRLGTTWAVRGGYFFDDSPAPAASLSPLLFDADRHGFTLGGSWAAGGVAHRRRGRATCPPRRDPPAAPAGRATRGPTRRSGCSRRRCSARVRLLIRP